MQKIKPLFPVLTGLVTTIAVILICIFLNYQTNTYIQSICVLFFVPVAAIIMGMACGIGVFWGVRVSNVKTGKKYYLLSGIMALLCFAGIYYAMYLVICAYYKTDMSFVSFMNEFILNAQSSLNSHGSTISFNPGSNLNSLGLMIEAAGFLIGGLCAGLFMMSNTRYCEKCNTYMKNKSLFTICATNHEKLVDELNAAITSESGICEYIREKKPGSKSEKKLAIQNNASFFEVELSFCKKCFDGFIVVRRMEIGGNSYDEKTEARQLIAIPTEISNKLLAL